MNRNRGLNRPMLGLFASLIAITPAVLAQTTELPQVRLLATDPTALEGTSAGAFTLIRNGPTNADLSVSLSISGSAVNGVDYVTIPSPATIPAGFLAVDILVQPLVDNANLGNKTVVVTVKTNSTYSILKGAAKATVKLVDDVFNLPPPTITLISPTNNSQFKYRSPITLEAEVSDAVPVKSVSFYANDDLIGRATNSPYTLVWTKARPGQYVLFARSADLIGQSALSAPAHITVTQILPVVSLVSPTNGMNFLAGDDITLQAEATDSDDAIRRVSFYANGHLLGAVTNTPYSLVWSNAHSGFYFVRAAAVDEAGDKGYSPTVFINVSRRPGLSRMMGNVSN